MFKMPHPGYHHYHIIVFAELYAVVVAHRAARLYYGINAFLMRHLYAVIERKESVRRHSGSLEGKAEFFCFVQCLAQCVYAACLSAAFTDELFIFYYGNSI